MCKVRNWGKEEYQQNRFMCCSVVGCVQEWIINMRRGFRHMWEKLTYAVTRTWNVNELNKCWHSNLKQNIQNVISSVLLSFNIRCSQLSLYPQFHFSPFKHQGLSFSHFRGTIHVLALCRAHLACSLVTHSKHLAIYPAHTGQEWPWHIVIDLYLFCLPLVWLLKWVKKGKGKRVSKIKDMRR